MAIVKFKCQSVNPLYLTTPLAFPNLVVGCDRGTLGCYNPWNYQARAMLSREQNPHSINKTPCASDFEPSFDQVWIPFLIERGIASFKTLPLALLDLYFVAS